MFLCFLFIGSYGQTAGTWVSPNGSWSGSLPLGPGAGQNTQVITFNVSGLPANAFLSQVCFQFNHSYNEDMDITLNGPLGSRDLCTDNGGSGDNMNLCLRDDAGSAITSISGNNVSGNYRPEAALRDLCGNPNGNWSITFADDANNDGGTLLSCSITFTTTSGDQITFGPSGTWYGYFYNGTDLNCYRGNSNSVGSPAFTNTAVPFDARYINPDGFSARYRQTFSVGTTGRYRITSASDDGVRINNNGTTNNWNIINDWTCSAATRTAEVDLNAGQAYNWTMEMRDCGGSQTANFSMCYAGSTPAYGINSWNSYAYNGKDLNTYMGKITSGITTNTLTNFTASWGTGSPATDGTCGAVNSDNFSTRHLMSGTFTRSFYKITYSSDDGVRISFDGGQNWTVNSWNDNTNSGTFTILLDGTYNIIVDHRENTGGAGVSIDFCQMAGNYTIAPNEWRMYVFDDQAIEFNKYRGTNTYSSLGFCHAWGTGQPPVSGNLCGLTMDNDYFSVRYTRIQNFVNGNYYIRVVSDDGMRFSTSTTNGIINWNIFNLWDNTTHDNTSGPIALNGNTEMYFDMREREGGATASVNIVKVPDNPTSITTNLPNNAICTPGGSITLTAQGAEGTVHWYTGSCGGAFIGTGNSIVVSPTTNTTYYARNRNYSDVGCTNILDFYSSGCASLEVKVGTPPVVNAGPDMVTCSSVQLNASATGSPYTANQTVYSADFSGSHNWTWTDAVRWGIVSSAIAGGTSPELRFQYSSGSNGTIVDANAMSPLINAAGYSSLKLSFKYMLDWFEQTVPLSLETSTNGTTWTTRWSVNPGSNVLANQVSNIDLSALDGQSFYIRFRFNGDIYNLDYWYIDDVTITGNMNAYHQVSYSWSPAGGLNNASISNPVATPSSTTIYTLTATSNGCVNTDAVQVNIGQIPAVPTVTAGTPSICAPGTTALNANGMAPGGQVFQGNGTNNSYVSVIQDLPEYNFTIELWAKTAQATGGIFSVVSLAGDPGGGGHDRHLFLSGGQLWVRVWSGSAWNTGVSLNDNQWHHVALTVQTGVGQKVYVDGNLVGIFAYDHSDFNWQTRFYIGYSDDVPANYFNGQIDNLRIWNTVRSQSDIRANMYLEAPVSSSGLVSHLPFNGNATAVVGPSGTSGSAVTYPAANYYTYTWSSGPNLPAASVLESQTTGSIATANNYNYRVTATAGSCAGTLSSMVPVTVNTPSSAPTSIIGVGTFCQGNQIGLSVNGGSLGSNANWEWFSGSCGGTSAGTGSSITVSPVAATNYYVRASAAGACAATACANGSVTMPTSTNILAQNNETATCVVTENNYVHFYNADGHLLASINSNGQNLGNVNITSYVDGSPIDIQACGTNQPWYVTTALGRRWVIKADNVVPGNVTARLYFDQAELDALQTASQNNANPSDDVYGINWLDLSKYSNTTNPALENGDFSDNCGSGSSSVFIQQGSGNATSVIPGFSASARYVQYNFTGFSEFWLSGTNNVSPLPIELVDFSASCQNGKVKLNWTTASELNNERFIIHRSADMVDWESIGTLPGAGTHNGTLQYNMLDDRPITGIAYYKLTQVDYDGQSETFDPINVICYSDGEGNSMLVYPNPATDRFTVSINSAQDMDAVIEVSDLNGKRLVTRNVALIEGNNEFGFDRTALQAGTYMIRLNSKVYIAPIKLIVQ